MTSDRCGYCNQPSSVLVHVGTWGVCPRCWTEGAKRSPALDLKMEEVAAERAGRPVPLRDGVKKGQKMGKSLVTGEAFVATDKVIDLRTGKTHERSAAKEDVGSFERHPNAPDLPARDEIKFTGGIQYVPDEDGYW